MKQILFLLFQGILVNANQWRRILLLFTIEHQFIESLSNDLSMNEFFS